MPEYSKNITGINTMMDYAKNVIKFFSSCNKNFIPFLEYSKNMTAYSKDRHISKVEKKNILFFQT